MNAEKEISALQQILQRERLARKEAEKILEAKASELQRANQALLQLNKHLEDTVQKRTKELESIARFTQENPDPLVRISYSGDIIKQNPSAEALLQSFAYKGKLYPQANFWKFIIHEIDFTEPRWNFEAASNEREFSFTCCLHSAEGYINIYGCDVTAQRMAQQALQESEQKWRFALKAAGDGIWEYNLLTKEIIFSRSYKDILGFANETYLNQERLWRSRIHPDDIHLIDSIIEDYAAGKIGHHSTQYRIRKRNSHYIWILDRGMLLGRSPDGKPLKIIGVHTNIDQQKKLELTLKSTATRLSTLISGLHVGVTMEDEQGNTLVTNKKMCDIFGMDYEDQKVRKENMSVIAGRVMATFKEPHLFLQSHYATIKNQKLVIGEKWELSDGRFISLNFIPVYSSEETFQGNLWVVDDITEQISNEKALKQQRQFYEHILNNIPADITVLDAQQRYLFVNPVRLKNEELRKWMIGKNDEAYCQDQNKPVIAFAAAKKKFEELLITKKLTSWEEEHTRSDGSKEYSLRNLYPVLNARDGVDMVIGYGLDITERKQIEQKIQLSEKKYRDLINFSYALIITHDINGKILTVNPSVCRTLEYLYPELIGKPLSHFMLPGDALKVETEYLQQIRTDNIAEGVFRVVSKSGKIIYLLYKNYLFLEAGEAPYVIGCAQDITERIKAEKELKLAKKVTEEAAVAKERFLADMSHEIRTPMNGILGLASLLEKTTLVAEQREHLQLLKESANNLLVIVNDVLDLEKIVSGKMELENIPFTVFDKVQTSIASFRFKVEEKGILLRHNNRLPKDLIVSGDPYRLSQVLNNLLSNALKFTNEGTITINTQLAEQKGNAVIIEYEVQDTGIGIPAEKWKQIFDPYMQAKPEISRKYGGTGLGLAICKNLVEMQKGTISIVSEEYKGSAFKFTIPYTLAKQAYKKAVALSGYNGTCLQGKKLLIAEDVQINQYLVQHFLKGSDCSLHFVDNGRKAVDYLMQNDYDLVLMDIQMPEMDGVEATKAIRELKDKHKAATPIIALTANALKGTDEKYLAAGMDDYLSKPFTKDGLFTTIERTFNKISKREIAVETDYHQSSPSR